MAFTEIDLPATTTKQKEILGILWEKAKVEQENLYTTSPLFDKIILDIAKEIGFDPFDILELRKASADLGMILIFTAANPNAWVFGRHCTVEKYGYLIHAKQRRYKAKSDNNGMLWIKEGEIQVSDYDPIGFYWYDAQRKHLGKVSLSDKFEVASRNPTVLSRSSGSMTASDVWRKINQKVHRKLQHGAYNDYGKIPIGADKKCVIFDSGKIRVCKSLSEMLEVYIQTGRSKKDWSYAMPDYLGNGHHVGYERKRRGLRD